MDNSEYSRFMVKCTVVMLFVDDEGGGRCVVVLLLLDSHGVERVRIYVRVRNK